MNCNIKGNSILFLMRDSLVFLDNSSSTGAKFSYNHSDKYCTNFSLWSVFCTKLPKEKVHLLKISVVIQTTVILTEDNHQSNSALEQLNS